MKLGKVSQTILKRSVLNLIKYKGEHNYKLPTMEEPTAIIKSRDESLILSAMASVSGNQKDIGVYAIARGIVDVMCKGGNATGVQVVIQLPEHAYESRLKAMVQAMEEFCEVVEVPLLNVQASVTSTITTSHVTITALGEVRECDFASLEDSQAGMDLVMIGEVGLEGALRLLSEQRTELEKRFAPSFLRTLEAKYDRMQVAIKACENVVKLGERHMHQVPESGVLGGLWEVASASSLGMEVQLKELPISQEVIEVCEYLGVNPYRLGAAGTVIVVAHNGKELVREMEKIGHKAVVIGKTTDSSDKILCNGEDIRHIERPVPNELYKVLEKRQEEC